MDIPIYVINFNDENRKNKMIQRFNSIGFELKFMDPVYESDLRITDGIKGGIKDGIPVKGGIPVNKIEKRTWSIMLQHLDSIRHFYETTTLPHCIVCEDDILISKNFKTDLPNIIQNFNQLKLDILLLGYLIPFKIESNLYFKPKTYQYLDYPNDLWGSQMYLVSRAYAKFLLEKYTIDYAISHLDEPYSPDWVITKNGNKAILYPMVAVEEGGTKTSNESQNNFHKRCFETNYDSNIHI